MIRHAGSLVLALLVAAAIFLSACTAPETGPAPAAIDQTPAGAVEASPPSPASATPPPASPSSPCGLAPVVAPTPAPDPGYTELDPSTGLHMTGKMQLLELDTYRLRVIGKVDRPLELTYDEIRCLPRVEAAPVLICPGFFEDRATWAGTPLAEILALAGIQEGAQRVKLTSADGYPSFLTLQDALDRTNFLAYEWESEPLPRLHGFPLRAVIPESPGSQWTKWLVEIEVQ